MVIGVKYCGGCNPVYSRGRQVKKIQEEFPDHTYVTPSDRKDCDIWLIVCGCLRACASTDGLTAEKKMFILGTERSFVEVRDYLLTEKKEQEETRREAGEKAARKRLRIGAEAGIKKTFFKDDVDKFASLTGDFSRLHTDPEFAKASVYKRPVVHGVLAASLISSVMGMKLPGEGTVLVEEQIRFLKPVFYGDTLTATVRLISCREGKKQYVATLSGICVNQDGETVIAARCRQMMDKELFEIENPEETAGALDEVY